MGGSSTRHLVSLLSACARLSHQPSAAWLDAAHAELARQPARISLRHLSDWLAALARLSRPPPPAWAAQMLGGVAGRLEEQGEPALLMHLVWAAARLRCPPPPAQREWAAVYARAAHRCLPDYSPSQLSLSLWALASWEGAPELVAHLAGPRRAAAPPAGGASAAGCWDSFDEDDEDAYDAGRLQRSRTAAAPPAAAAAPVQDAGAGLRRGGLVGAMVERAVAQLSLMRPADVVTVVWALAK